MKTKRKKHVLLKLFLFLIFMFFVCYKTINFLYKRMNITNQEYINLLLSDTYREKDNNFINNAVKLFSKNFDPLEVLQVPKVNNSSSSSDEYNYDELKEMSMYIKDPNPRNIDNPAVYIYNTHQLENYADDIEIYSVTPNVMMASYLLKEKLNNQNIPAIVESTNINNYMLSNNYDDYYKASRQLIIDNKKKYKSIKYYIDIHRDDVNKEISTLEIHSKKYARILFIIGMENPYYKDNLDVISRLNARLNESYPGITRGILKKSGDQVEGIYNQDVDRNVILIELGGINNNIQEVLNTIEVFSLVFSEFIGE